MSLKTCTLIILNDHFEAYHISVGNNFPLYFFNIQENQNEI